MDESKTSTDLDLFHYQTSRLEALSDGIFAIAMTVLVLNLGPMKFEQKNPTEAQILEALSNMLPDFFAFAGSFITLGMYWMGHHTMFRFIEKADRTIFWLNLYFLMFVSLMPFTTGLYAGDENSRIANTIFGANLVVLGLLSYAMWAYSIKRKLIPKDFPIEAVQFTSRRILTGPLLASIALAVSLFQPIYAEYIYFAMVPTFMFTARMPVLERPEKRGNNSGRLSS
jgi:uncharacterized membrane protein